MLVRQCDRTWRTGDGHLSTLDEKRKKVPPIRSYPSTLTRGATSRHADTRRSRRKTGISTKQPDSPRMHSLFRSPERETLLVSTNKLFTASRRPVGDNGGNRRWLAVRLEQSLVPSRVVEVADNSRPRERRRHWRTFRKSFDRLGPETGCQRSRAVQRRQGRGTVRPAEHEWRAHRWTAASGAVPIKLKVAKGTTVHAAVALVRLPLLLQHHAPPFCASVLEPDLRTYPEDTVEYTYVRVPCASR